MPRSKSRAVVRSSMSSGRSRWAMPCGSVGGPQQPVVEPRRQRVAEVHARPGPAAAGVTCMTTKITPTAVSGPPRASPCWTARTSTPMATTKAAGRTPPRSEQRPPGRRQPPVGPRQARRRTSRPRTGSDALHDPIIVPPAPPPTPAAAEVGQRTRTRRRVSVAGCGSVGIAGDDGHHVVGAGQAPLDRLLDREPDDLVGRARAPGRARAGRPTTW